MATIDIESIIPQQAKDDVTFVADGFDNILDKLKSVVKLYGEFKKLAEGKNGGSLAGLNVLNQESLKVQAELIVSIKQFNAEQRKQAQETQKLTQSRKESAANDRELKKELDAYTKSVKEGQKELQRLAKEHENLTKKKQHQAKAADLKQQLKDEAAAAKETSRIIKELGKEIGVLSQQTAAEQKEVEKLKNGYTRLNAAHLKALNAARQAGAEFGVESQQFKEAAENANILGAKLAEIDGKIIQGRQNLTTYSKQWNGLSYSLGMIVSEIPNAAQSAEVFFRSIGNNILPVYQSIQMVVQQNKEFIAQGKPVTSVWKQIGQAIFSINSALAVGVTLLVAYGDDIWKALTKAGKGIEEATDGTKIFTTETTVLSQIFQEAATSYSKTAAELDILKMRFQDTAATEKTKTEVVRTLNEKYEDTIGHLNGINEAEDFFIRRSDAYVQSLALRAQIEGAYNMIAENTNTVLRQQAKTVDENTTGWQKFSAFNKTFFSGAGLKAVGKNLADAFSGKWSNNFSQLYDSELNWQSILNNAGIDNAVTRSNSIIKDFILKTQKELTALNTEFGFGDGQKEPKGKQPLDMTNEKLEAEKRRLKALADMKKSELEDERDKQKAIADNADIDIRDRLNAYQLYTVARQQILKLSEDEELATIQLKLDKIAEIEGKADEKRTNEEKKLVVEKDALEAEKAAAVKKFAKESSDIVRDATQDQTKMYKGYTDDVIDYQIDALQSLAENVSTKQGGAVQAEYDKLGRGAINYKTFKENIRKINLQYDKLLVDESISYLQQILDEEELTAEQRKDIQKKLTDYKIKSNKLEQDSIEETAKNSEQRRKESLDAWLKAARDVMNTYAQISAYNTQKTINNINEEEKALDRKLDREIRNIELSTLSNEDKQTAIQDAEAATDGQRQRFEEERAQAQVRQAILEKSIAILQAVVNTYAAVAEALPNIPKSIAVGVAGAAAVAAIAAAPIPSYAHETPAGGHPDDGLAVVGDATVPEVVFTNGRAYLATTPTLVDLNKGDHVKHLDKVSANLMPNGLTPIQDNTGAYVLNAALRQGFADVSRSIIDGVSRQTNISYQLSDGEFRKVVIKGNHRTKYLNSHFK